MHLVGSELYPTGPEFKQLAAVVLNGEKKLFLLKDLVPLVQNVGMTH